MGADVSRSIDSAAMFPGSLGRVAKAAKQALSKPIIVNTAPAKPSKKAAKPKVSHDLMDSRLMLFGSYGHGKRR